MSIQEIACTDPRMYRACFRIDKVEIDLGIYADLGPAQVAHDIMSFRQNWRSGSDDDDARRLPEPTSSLFFPLPAYETMSRDIIKEMQQHDLEELSVQLKCNGRAAELYRKLPSQYKPIVEAPLPPPKRADEPTNSSPKSLFGSNRQRKRKQLQQGMRSTDTDEESQEGTITPDSKLQKAGLKPLANRGTGKKGGKLAQLLKKKKK